MWLQDTSCLKLIHDSWANKVVGCSMFILQHKLKFLKIELRDWNKNSFGNVHNAVLLKQGLFLGIQQNLEIPSLSDIVEEVLNRGISKLVNDKKILHMASPQGCLTPSHILYADDIFVFCRGILSLLEI